MTWNLRSLIRLGMGGLVAAGVAGIGPASALADIPSTSVTVAPISGSISGPSAASTPVPSSGFVSAGTDGVTSPSAGTVEPAAASGGTTASDIDARGAELTPGLFEGNVGAINGRTRSTSGQVSVCGANASLNQSGLGKPTCPTAGEGGSKAAAPSAGVGRGRAAGNASGSGSNGFMAACSPAVAFGGATFDTAGCSPEAAGDGSAGAAGRGRQNAATAGPSSSQAGSGAGGSAANGRGGQAQTVIGMCMQGARRTAEFLPLGLVVAAAAAAGWLFGVRARSTAH